MTDLTPITALGTAEAPSVAFGPLTVAEDARLGLASLALRRGADVPEPMGLKLPGPGDCVAGAGVGAFWTGPGQWMLEAPGRAEEDFAAEVARNAPGCSVTEQTDGWAAFDIVSDAGAAPVDALLERLVNLPPASLLPGKATRTVLEHLGVFVIRRAGDRLTVLGMRSAAGSLWHALTVAAKRREDAG
ncbi:sarcosine oxidase subunit gamma [Psychromarinibacter sp. C21-152]|uniref:Sarcosine oxidase subunit gamma n=1 Tax=Psychromarinibacter sediminicola TaxID=3033385 RepID=A0AAE3NV62_9RHOB|nr:sarcosine oxidase subunit gamma [Psychromarinibacter sediminicola]MDF0602871.1 sarcosine oxidase subunit gamma [Psychromarinibacter sediminicola]